MTSRAPSRQAAAASAAVRTARTSAPCRFAASRIRLRNIRSSTTADHHRRYVPMDRAIRDRGA